MNTTITSLKTAIEGIPNWTKASNGTDAYYTAGNVGIGTSSVFSATTYSELNISRNSSNGYAQLRLSADDNYALFYRSSTTNANDIFSGTGSTGGALVMHHLGSTGGIMIATQSSTPIQFYTNGSSSARMQIAASGSVTVTGALSKGSGTFDIAHPDPLMPKNSRLRHSFVESPTAGDNIYRWQIKVTRENGKFFIKLPKYWNHLNTNPMVWVSSAEQPAASYGYVDMTQEKVIVQADRVGTYNVLLLGTRKDSLAINNWKELGMEYISKGIGEAEKILSYNAQPEFGEEPQTVSSVKTIHELSQKAANEKKLLSLEEENLRLKKKLTSLETEVKTIHELSQRDHERSERERLTSLRLEDRLRAIENLQMARK